jgi:hypothetical protein
MVTKMPGLKAIPPRARLDEARVDFSAGDPTLL